MKLFNKKLQAFKFIHKGHEIIITNSIKGIRIYLDGEEYNVVVHDSMTFCDARLNIENDDIYICLWSGIADVNIMAVTGDVIHFTSDEKNEEFNADFNGHKLRINEKALGERRIYLDGELVSRDGVISDAPLAPKTLYVDRKPVFIMASIRERKTFTATTDYTLISGYAFNIVVGEYNAGERKFLDV